MIPMSSGEAFCMTGDERTSSSDNAKRIDYKTDGAVVTITLNRPQALNAMDRRMHEELSQALDAFEHDPMLRLAVLTGAGQRAFCAGKDLHELSQDIRDGVPPRSFGSKGEPGWPRLTERFGVGKPIIARVDGFAIGGGFELALACDVVLASDRSSFSLPEARLGLIPGAGGLFRLTRQAPFKVAMGHLLTGRSMSASRAYELGLINEVVPAAELDRHLESWKSDLLSCSPWSQRSLKQVTEASYHLSLEDAFKRHYEAEDDRCAQMDCREGPLAFTERRKPVWGKTS